MWRNHGDNVILLILQTIVFTIIMVKNYDFAKFTVDPNIHKTKPSLKELERVIC